MSTALVVCHDTETKIGSGNNSPLQLDDCVVLISLHFCNGPRYLDCVLSMPAALSGWLLRWWTTVNKSETRSTSSLQKQSSSASTLLFLSQITRYSCFSPLLWIDRNWGCILWAFRCFDDIQVMFCCFLEIDPSGTCFAKFDDELREERLHSNFGRLKSKFRSLCPLWTKFDDSSPNRWKYFSHQCAVCCLQRSLLHSFDGEGFTADPADFHAIRFMPICD